MGTMVDEIIRRAWREESVPPDCDPVQFLFLRAVYREYRRGTIERDTAEQLKARCMAFEELTPKELRSFAVFAIESELEGRDLEDVRILMRSLIEATSKLVSLES